MMIENSNETIRRPCYLVSSHARGDTSNDVIEYEGSLGA